MGALKNYLEAKMTYFLGNMKISENQKLRPLRESQRDSGLQPNVATTTEWLRWVIGFTIPPTLKVVAVFLPLP